MKKYTICIDSVVSFASTSRNAKKHLRDNGGNCCRVYYGDKLISMAGRDCCNPYKIYQCYVGK